MAVVVVIGGVGLAGSALRAGAVDVPQRSAAEVLVLAQSADPGPLRGSVEVIADLGLPAMLLEAQGAGSPLAYLAGTHTMRVWTDGAQRQRVQVLDPMAESNLVRDGDTLWTYVSGTGEATKVTLPEHPAQAGDPAAALEPGATPPTPQEVADRILAALPDRTDVSVGDPVEVAGRAAYELRLDPTDDRSTIGRLSMAVDAESGVVLRVGVRARGADQPAFQVGFTDLAFGPPDAGLFAFSPPAGATVTERDYSDKPGAAGAPVPGEPEPAGPEPGQATVVGDGWAAVVQAPAADVTLPEGLARPVPGGSLVSTALVNVLLTDDGRAFVGAVTPATLQAAAG